MPGVVANRRKTASAVPRTPMVLRGSTLRMGKGGRIVGIALLESAKRPKQTGGPDALIVGPKIGRG